MSQPQSSRIPLTLKQRIFLTVLFLLALVLSYFVVSTLDPLPSNLRLSSANGSRGDKIIDPRVFLTARQELHHGDAASRIEYR